MRPLTQTDGDDAIGEPVVAHELPDIKGSFYGLQQRLGHKSIKTPEPYLEQLTPSQQRFVQSGEVQKGRSTNGSTTKMRKIMAETLAQLAETEGFEPSVRFTPYDGLANRWFQPLTHVSALWLAGL